MSYYHNQYNPPGHLPTDYEMEELHEDERCQEGGRHMDALKEKLIAPTRGTIRVCKDCYIEDS